MAEARGTQCGLSHLDRQGMIKEKPSTRAGVLTPFCPCLFPGRRPDRVLAGREKNQ